MPPTNLFYWPAWSGVLVSTSLSKLSSWMEAVLGSFSHHLPSTLLPPAVSHHVLLVQVPFSPSEPLLPRHPNPMVPVLPVCCCVKKNFGKMEFKRCLGWALWHSGLSHSLGCSYCISEYLGVNLRSPLDSC